MPKNASMDVIRGFDWDSGNWPKCGKHGLTKEEVEEVFYNTPRVHFDDGHSDAEDRYKAIGMNKEGRYVFVVFTFRAKEGGLYIRPISARYMHREEVEHYERYSEGQGAEEAAAPENR